MRNLEDDDDDDDDDDPNAILEGAADFQETNLPTGGESSTNGE